MNTIQNEAEAPPIQQHTLKQLLRTTTASMQQQEFTKKMVIELSLLAQALELNTVPQQRDQNFSEIESLLYRIILENDSGSSRSGSSGEKRHRVPVDVNIFRRTLCRTVGALYGKQTHLVSAFVNRLSKELAAVFTQKNVSWEINATCILHCLGALYAHAATYMPPLTNIMSLLLRLWKYGDIDLRIGAITLLTEYASSSNHSSLSHDWSEILKFCRLAISETKSSILRLTAAVCLNMIAKTVSPRAAFSKNFEASLALCIRGMEDADSNVRSMFGTAAGQLLFGVTPFSTNSSPSMQGDMKSKDTGATQVEKRSGFTVLARKKSRAYTFISSLIVLTSPFSKVGASKYVRHSISVAVISYLKQCSLQALHQNMDVLISHLIGLLSNVKNYVTANDLQQAMFYVGNMIRMGIAYHMDESGRISALKELSKIVNHFTDNEYALVCILREIAVLCKLTGETVITQRDMVLDTVLLCLRHSSEYVRFVGCMVLRALSESIPSQTMSLVNAMLNMVQMDLAELAISSANFDVQYGNSLHGHANALAALISVSSRHKLSVSYLLCSASLDTAVLLANKNTPNDNEYVTMRRDEACWTLVSAVLSLNDTWLKNTMDKILDLWDNALGTKAATSFSSDPSIFLYQLKSRSMAVLSVAIFLKRCPELLSTEQMTLFYKYLENTTELISSLPSTFKPSSTATVHAMTLLKMYLFDAFRRLPSDIISNRQHRSTINLITKMAFAEADGTATMVETSLLHSILDPTRDSSDLNGPTNDQMKELLDGEDIDTVGYFHDEELMDDSILEADSSCVFHDSSKFFLSKPLSLSTRLVDHSIKLLGRVFVFHRPTSKKQIIDHFVNQLKLILAKPEDVHGSHIVFSNVIASIYCILKQLMQHEMDRKGDRSFISGIHAILNSSLGHRNGKIRRSSSECMALLGKLVGKSLLDDIIKRCAVKIVGDGPINAGYALALGSVNHSLGSLTALSYLPSTVSFLHALARANSSKIQLSALHSLYKTIESCGAGFSSHIDATLQLITTIVFSAREKSSSVSYTSDQHVLLGCSRIMAAMIGLGPEVSNNADFSSLYRFFIHDFLCSSLESVQLEATLLIERAAVLAPNLLFAMNQLLIPKLRELLVSETTGNNLRQMAASSVKILAEREPGLVGDLMPIDLLFQMLNNVHQFDDKHKNNFEEIILLLLKSKSYQPNRWIELVHEIVSSQPKQYSLAIDDAHGELMADTDSKADGVHEVEASHPIFYSWQSKLFALVCLRLLMELHRDNEDHVATQNTRKSTENPLVPYINKIIDIATIAASRGTVSSIREGLLIMKSLIEIFGSVPDPDVQSEVILQQHSAKFSATIAQGFESASLPLVMIASVELVAALVCSDIVKSQVQTMSRSCGYLTNHLSSLKAMHFTQYGEIAAAMVKIAILHALADIYINAHRSSNKKLLVLLQEYVDKYLLQFWNDMLVDYATLSLGSADHEHGKSARLSVTAQQAVKSLPKYFYEEGLESAVVHYFEEAYPSVMNALVRAGTRPQDPIYDTTQSGGHAIQIKLLADMIKPGLIVGLAARGLYDRASWRNKQEQTSDTSISIPSHRWNLTALLFIDTLQRVVETKQFMLLPQASDQIYEIFLWLIKMQDNRHAQLQIACIDLMTTIVTSCDSDFFAKGTQSAEVVLTTIVEVCLKPLRLQFPSMFEQDSEVHLHGFQFDKEHLNIVVRCMKCLKHILRRFAIGMHGGNITTILYTICRVLQFTQSNSVLEVAATLTVLTPDSPAKIQHQLPDEEDIDQDSPTVWNIAFRAAIENLLTRMTKYIITTPGEVELLFICLFGIQKNTNGPSDRLSLQTVQGEVVDTFNRLLQDTDTFGDAHKLKIVCWVLRGMQDGVLRLAKAGHMSYAIHYLGQLCPSIVTFLIDIAHNKIYITGSENDSEQLIMQVMPAGLNILLAAFSLLGDSSQRKSFLAVVIPLLVVLLRFTDHPSRSKNMHRLHKLCVECLERLATTAVDEFKQLIQEMPSEVVEEIQNAAKKKAIKERPEVQDSSVKESRASSMSINFNQYK